MRPVIGILVALVVVLAATLLVTGCPKKEAPPTGELKSTETEPAPIVAPKGEEKTEEGVGAEAPKATEEGAAAEGEEKASTEEGVEGGKEAKEGSVSGEESTEKETSTE